MFCHALMEWLDEQDIPYEEYDVSDPFNAAKAEKELGHEIDAVPISVFEGEEISGFDRPALKKLIKKMQK